MGTRSLGHWINWEVPWLLTLRSVLWPGVAHCLSDPQSLHLQVGVITPFSGSHTKPSAQHTVDAWWISALPHSSFFLLSIQSRCAPITFHLSFLPQPTPPAPLHPSSVKQEVLILTQNHLPWVHDLEFLNQTTEHPKIERKKREKTAKIISSGELSVPCSTNDYFCKLPSLVSFRYFRTTLITRQEAEKQVLGTRICLVTTRSKIFL